ncbi:hypothetical protein [Rhizorhapis suberifaciens]|uniref:Uncharacterized protein n=1 Tax=Rhizorhapis suberifaciens TaxID=13656 RepID=A0A840HXR6_9SPHN|nr:hypothetical protein [Rhizorhapis suberifaciens]MBB4642350.1 hypothetical protein [Rhizorhapis suberifaciens]
MHADTRAKIATLCRLNYLSDERIARYVAAPHEGVTAANVAAVRKTASGNANTGKGRARGQFVRDCEDYATLEYERRCFDAALSSRRMLEKLRQYQVGAC